MNQTYDSADKTVEKVRGKPFISGDDPRRNLEGRPKGTKNFTTYWEEAIKKIAIEKNLEENEVEVDLVMTAYRLAKRGNYSFFKEIMDRKYGKPLQTIDKTTKSISIELRGELSPERRQLIEEYEAKLKELKTK